MPVDSMEVSGVHVTFNTAEEWRILADLGFMQRMGIQYHWDNNGYSTFEDYLSDLKQSKRKSVRQVCLGLAYHAMLFWRSVPCAISRQSHVLPTTTLLGSLAIHCT